MNTPDFHCHQVFTRFAERCVSCMLCFQDCELLSKLNLSPQEIAATLGSGNYTATLVESIQQCSQCGLCSQNCPVGLAPHELMLVARQLLVKDGLVRAEDYRPLLVDREHHLFNLYRQTWGIDYSDLHRSQSPVLFVPGCTLASYAPDLTRTACAWLQHQGLDVGLNEQCCGLPLASIGLAERHEQYIARLREEFARAGVQQLVIACPNCFYHFKENFPDIGISSLYELLVSAGVRVDSAEGSVTVHDSCPDRNSGRIGRAVRTLLGGNTVVEPIHTGVMTICCGSGGLVSMNDPELSDKRAAVRFEELRKGAPQYCVCACMACVKRLESAQSAAPDGTTGQHDGVSDPLQVVHILELVFKQRVDHDRLQRQLEQMWAGEQGERNAQLLNREAVDHE